MPDLDVDGEWLEPMTAGAGTCAVMVGMVPLDDRPDSSTRAVAVLAAADLVLGSPGGRGAVRELADALLALARATAGR